MVPFRTWEAILHPGFPEIPNFTSLIGQVLSSLEGPPVEGRVPLRDLSITLDVFVLTLPLEVELPPATDPQHHRYGGQHETSGDPRRIVAPGLTFAPTLFTV